MSRGYQVEASASHTVSCAQVRRILPKVINGSPQCYSGPGQFHPCRLEGFYCTLASGAGSGESSTARCVKGRKLIVGRT
jgi:hypothetical protein